MRPRVGWRTSWGSEPRHRHDPHRRRRHDPRPATDARRSRGGGRGLSARRWTSTWCVPGARANRPTSDVPRHLSGRGGRRRAGTVAVGRRDTSAPLPLSSRRPPPRRSRWTRLRGSATFASARRPSTPYWHDGVLHAHGVEIETPFPVGQIEVAGDTVLVGGRIGRRRQSGGMGAGPRRPARAGPRRGVGGRS